MGLRNVLSASIIQEVSAATLHVMLKGKADRRGEQRRGEKQ